MREFRKFFIVQVLGVIALLAALLVIAVSYKSREIDVVAANDYVQTAKENWDNLEVLDDRGFETDILIFDRDNQVVYSPEGDLFSEIHSPLDAMRKNMLAMPICDDEIFLGTMVFLNPSKTAYDDTVRRIFLIAFLAAAIMLLSYAAFFYYINRNIIRPFRRMKKYAALIAQGKLDEPLIMERNNIFGIFTETFDIMREELQRAKDKEKELIASLSHDLKTPVTGIKLICELLEVKVEDEYVRGKIAGIVRKTGEMNVLLNNLLSSALDDLSEMNVNCSEVTSAVLGDLLDEHDPHKKIVAAEIPGCLINVDRNRLSQVIGNIISNSYKYADTRIDVNYSFHENYLQMDILDYGKGVDEEELSLLTNKFYRGKNNTSEKEGSGLGLYISKELMEKMQGQLICRGEKEGFCVTLMIPLA